MLPSLSSAAAAAAAAASPGSTLGSSPEGGNAASAEGRRSPNRPRWETLRGKQSKRAGLAPPSARHCQSRGPASCGLGGHAASTPSGSSGRSAGRQDPRPTARPLPAPRGYRWIPPHAASPRRRSGLAQKRPLPAASSALLPSPPRPARRGAARTGRRLPPRREPFPPLPSRRGPAPGTRPAAAPIARAAGRAGTAAQRSFPRGGR